MKKKISFIINPISGGIKKETFPALIGKHIDRNKFDVEINFTKSAEHNIELAQEAVSKQKDVIVAVGGDGTINNVAKYVTGSNSIFGIIPLGSGNGLARHLNIPLNKQKALEVINRLNHIAIDTGKANDEFFINVAGAGFDAHVSWMFANAPKRGFVSYAKITMNEFAKYEPRSYELYIDGEKIVEDAFLICVANGSQYGNNAFIAPKADVSDGRFEVSLLKPFQVASMPLIAIDMFTKRFDRSKYVKVFHGKHIVIHRPGNEVVNIDGEPVMMEKELDIRILPLSLNVIIP